MSTHPDHAALLERLKQEIIANEWRISKVPYDWEKNVFRDQIKMFTDAITALSAAPLGCAEAGERRDIDADFRRIMDILHECFYIEGDETPIFKRSEAASKIQQLFSLTPRPSPSPAGGADLVKALKPFAALAELTTIKACDNEAETFMSAADYLGARYPVLTVGDIRRAAAAYDAATQATPAKEGK